MKGALVLFLLCAFVAAINAIPSDEMETEKPIFPWYNTYSYQYMMCRMKCRQSCLEQGYWKGVCKQGACYCFGPYGPFGPSNNKFPNFPNYPNSQF